MDNALKLIAFLNDLAIIHQSGMAILNGPLMSGKDLSDAEVNAVVARAAGSVNNLRAVIRAKKAEQ